ncbi:hypothetical protein NVV94_12160 [Pseudomonas sp. LS1212]|uniref:hypothetical protein n=1 Tax=Pseudomonas sp. LS1212 TaxID=2972478 RepID=UPI00215B82CB|nr:hypothetical protein [Pseudomonas sp. LS1212]UVJ46218.1 hypothetical protein NVV94_12160 [Pseudomonas sp. LS1212]
MTPHELQGVVHLLDGHFTQQVDVPMQKKRSLRVRHPPQLRRKRDSRTGYDGKVGELGTRVEQMVFFAPGTHKSLMHIVGGVISQVSHPIHKVSARFVR